MKKVVYFILVSLLAFTSCKEESINPVVVETIPAPPTLPTPKDTSSNIAVPVVLTWNESSGATNYALQVSKDSSFSSLVYNIDSLIVTSKQVTDLDGLKKYYWHVSAKNNFGTKGWSETWSFITASIFNCGTSTIEYSGKTYNTVKIGTQCWLKENLDVGVYVASTGRLGIHTDVSNNGIIEKYCYGNNEANCATYGGLYDWNEAMQYVTTEKAKGICPTGWHIPTKSEFEILMLNNSNDANALKEIGQGTGSGMGTNTNGFSALLAGNRRWDGYFENSSTISFFWSSTVSDLGGQYNFYLWSDTNIIWMNNWDDNNGFSIRCIKDN
jgi:uncharacterized protein (TIGR02145 family)